MNCGQIGVAGASQGAMVCSHLHGVRLPVGHATKDAGHVLQDAVCISLRAKNSVDRKARLLTFWGIYKLIAVLRQLNEVDPAEITGADKIASSIPRSRKQVVETANWTSGPLPAFFKSAIKRH